MRDSCRPFEPLLSAWIDGELDDAERAAVGGHVASCARCRSDIATLRVTKTMLGSIPARQTPAVARGRPRISGGRPHRRAVRRVASRALAGVAAGLFALMAAAFALGAPDDTKTVTVPVEVFVAQHLVQSVGGPVSTPVVVNAP